MSKFLDSTGLSRLVENIKNKFQKKKTHCKLWDDGGNWTMTINNDKEYEIRAKGSDLYNILIDNLNNLEFEVDIRDDDGLNTCHNVAYSVRSDNNYGIMLELLCTGKAWNYDTEELAMLKIGINLMTDSEGDTQVWYPAETVNVLKLNMVNSLTNSGDGTKFLADDGSYVDISKLITFEAENGSLNAEQTDAIEEGYIRNLPIYVLYSGIKMLVNSIQKLGDIYSLSCRHDNATYSITMNLDDDSYEIASIGE